MGLAAAVLIKTIPVFLIPWLMWKHWRSGVVCIALIIIGYVPFLGAGLGIESGTKTGILASLIRFPRDTEMLGIIHGMLRALVDGSVARLICFIGIIVVSMYSSVRIQSFHRAAFCVVGGLLLFMPIVHYWYLCWVVMLLPFFPRWSIIVATGSMVFYFEALRTQILTGHWEMPLWVAWAIYIPFSLAEIIDVARARSAKRLLVGNVDVAADLSNGR